MPIPTRMDNNMSNQFSVGMIGAGFISDYHIRGLREAGAAVTAIASQTHASAQRKAAQYDIPTATDDYQDILKQDDIDAVVIATPDFTHKDLTIDALEAGKPVLLQKPMARNVAECQAIIDAAKSTGTPLYVSFMHRYFEEIVMMRELLAQKALGMVFSVRQRNATPGAGWAAWFYSKENVGGGALLQLGVHGIDLLRYIFGDIEAVKATTALQKRERLLDDNTVIHPDAEDLIFTTYRFQSGVIATHETVYNEIAGTDRFRMEIYGEQGTAWLRTEKGDLAVYAPQHYQHEGWFVPDLPTVPLGKRHHQHFIDMVRGDAPPDDSAHDGLASIAVCEAIYRSAETDQWEEVTR